MPITPNRDQFIAYAGNERPGEVVMVNLLKFKERASGEEGSGAEAYGRYSDAVVKQVEARGGRIVWMGRVENVLIGDTEADGWDVVALVAYPSRQAFIDMVSSSEYQESHTHREAGLERTVLLGCEETVRP